MEELGLGTQSVSQLDCLGKGGQRAWPGGVLDSYENPTNRTHSDSAIPMPRVLHSGTGAMRPNTHPVAINPYVKADAGASSCRREA